MAKKDEKIIIDPKEFAQMVLPGSPKKDDEDDLVYIKRQLRLYLEALMLAQDFNDLEKTQFDVAKQTQRDAILQKIIERRY
ncbi:hypothetical protein MK904_07430 [Loigolactobacillus coryniformis]|jgi:hypothetical protein|uniref:Uncharacterized protein n=1 Tax=Loigolactobacillus coryniformis subsp. coryniformis KCTC 3167 = DSM 20001 TaxID=913848 RepID=A0A0R1FCH4_9LACO|nr:hypothetical protein [Loigolactobacillus coryniformis]MDT3392744.1 hypothetical protein [Bacillota bacterium]ATO56443.1 hypothetical protein LC20001_12785 [Loigolactobacillus coryniformis subsp. coryniformis KCTC 3167 = DSM 20001]KRK19278.1 hypothetical protein FD22_GL000018 [Loigolactobacillus coryniformis subsp. coryniformis KCTC 3167 = DSM 20001]MCL5457902.1 hypothetical protein [Loigolactobacillus coryniformis]MDC4185933.1 hypothetical protein [Loigolactobacillus coryniformis]